MSKLVTLIALIGTLLSVSSAFSETRLRGLQCVQDYYGLKEDNEDDPDLRELAFVPDLGTQLLQDIVSRANMQLNPTAIKCDKVANAIPFQPEDKDNLPEPLRSKQFVIYNLLWIQQTLGKNRDRAVFLLGHELGHIYRNHLTLRADIPRLQMESEADFEGYCAVARLGGDWAVVEELVLRLRGDQDTEYPSASNSLRLGRRAFEKCGGSEKLKSNNAKTKIVYFYKRADEGRVVTTLNQLGVNFETRQSGVYLGIDYSDRKTDAVTCHDGVPIEFVRNVALALFEEGVGLRAISEPDPENDRFKKRITIEAVAKGRPKLSREEIDNLQECPSHFDPVYGKFR